MRGEEERVSDFRQKSLQLNEEDLTSHAYSQVLSTPKCITFTRLLRIYGRNVLYRLQIKPKKQFQISDNLYSDQTKDTLNIKTQALQNIYSKNQNHQTLSEIGMLV